MIALDAHLPLPARVAVCAALALRDTDALADALTTSLDPAQRLAWLSAMSPSLLDAGLYEAVFARLLVHESVDEVIFTDLEVAPPAIRFLLDLADRARFLAVGHRAPTG